MLFERFEIAGLSHYSYAIASRTGGDAVIVDPERVVDRYLAWASDHEVRIAHVLETHIHADYASGARELAARGGAELCLSAYDEGELYEASFPHRELRDGDRLSLGAVEVEALHTPGHTPEHLAFLVWESGRPRRLLSGDFLFVGSLGRPDLLGEEYTPGLARRLYASVREKLSGLPDPLAICPAHGAGSMCGGGMGASASSTLGAERAANPYLDPALSEEAFVERLLAGVPPRPEYYTRMKRLNSDGPAPFGDLPGPSPLTPAQLWDRSGEGAVVVDVREPASFGRGHVPGSFGIGLGPDLAVWASWVVPYDAPLLIVAADDGLVGEARAWLARVGLDRVEGFLAGGLHAWTDAGFQTRTLERIDPPALAARLERGDIRVLDVRSGAEWSAGRIPGAIHVMAARLSGELDPLRADGRELAVVCAEGYRSTVAASLLSRAGFERVLNVEAGMNGWVAADLPLETAWRSHGAHPAPP